MEIDRSRTAIIVKRKPLYIYYRTLEPSEAFSRGIWRAPSRPECRIRFCGTRPNSNPYKLRCSTEPVIRKSRVRYYSISNNIRSCFSYRGAFVAGNWCGDLFETVGAMVYPENGLEDGGVRLLPKDDVA